MRVASPLIKPRLRKRPMNGLRCLSNNYDRMRYAGACRRGLPISSGNVEGHVLRDALHPNHTNEDVNPKLAVDSSGNVFAVWSQLGAPLSNVFASRYAVDGGWGVATLIEDEDTASARNPAVIVDQAGNALVVWTVDYTTTFNLSATRYVVGSG